MTFEQFKDNYYKEILPNKDFDTRNGECLMIYLSEIWMDEYKRLRSSSYYRDYNLDCYHNDNLITYTLNHLKGVWYNFNNSITTIYYTTYNLTNLYYINNNKIILISEIEKSDEINIRNWLYQNNFTGDIKLINL